MSRLVQCSLWFAAVWYYTDGMSILDRILSDIDSTRAIAESNAAKLDQILAILNEQPSDPIAGAQITLTEGAAMPAKAHAKAAVIGDFQLLDNGTATGTISFVDSVGEPTSPMAGATVGTNVTSSDPGIVPSLDSTGLIVTLAPASPIPNPLPTGVVVTCVVTITNPAGTTPATVGPFTVATQPVDLVAGGPAGASIVLS